MSEGALAFTGAKQPKQRQTRWSILDVVDGLSGQASLPRNLSEALTGFADGQPIPLDAPGGRTASPQITWEFRCDGVRSYQVGVALKDLAHDPQSLLATSQAPCRAGAPAFRSPSNRCGQCLGRMAVPLIPERSFAGPPM